MIIAIASGKGGTGKTTVATNLALSLAGTRSATESDKPGVVYADCDVEEPNGALFLNPDLSHERDVELLVPRVDAERCTHCGRCAEGDAV